MRILTLLLIPTLVTASAGAARAATETFYRWQDQGGVVHVSNRADRAPESAARIEIQRSAAGASARVATASQQAYAAPVGPAAPCSAPDASGVVDAVVDRLVRTDRLRDLDTLLVAAEPVLVEPGSSLFLGRGYGDAPATFTWSSDRAFAEPGAVVVDRRAIGVDELAERTAATEQAAVAYPAGDRCPTRPPLVRYAVASARRPTRSICEDYRRAFNQVGVTRNRDRHVATSFREMAKRFVAVAAHEYVAADGAEAVALPAWVVEAHVAQVAELADETGTLVDELTVALEEIDRAARANDCW